MHLTDFFVDGPLYSYDFTLFSRFVSLKARLIYLFFQRAKASKKKKNKLVHPPFINKIMKWFQALCSYFYEYFSLKLSGFVLSAALLYIFTGSS